MITEEEKDICIRAIREKKAIRVLIREGYEKELFELLL